MKSVLSLVVAAGLSAGAAWAQDAEVGKEIYERYCATCHDLSATGNGPMAPVLVLQPTNLTALTQNNDGVFPMQRVVMRIDGRDPLVSHGSPMPVYGDFFEGETISLKTESGQPILTSPAVVDLVTYLQGLQK